MSAGTRTRDRRGAHLAVAEVTCSRRVKFIDDMTIKIDEGLLIVQRGRELGQHEQAELTLMQCAYLDTLVEQAKAMTDEEWDLTHPRSQPTLRQRIAALLKR